MHSICDTHTQSTLCLVYQKWFNKIAYDFRHRYELFDKKLRPCHRKALIKEFLWCLKKEFVNILHENGHQCLPLLGWNVLKEAFSNLTLCTNVEDSTNNFVLLTQIIQNGLANDLENCKLPCNQELISSSSSVLNVVGTYL